MIISKQLKSFILLTLFFISLIFQIVYTFNISTELQTSPKANHSSFKKKSNLTDDNLLNNFIEEETEDGNEQELDYTSIDFNWVLSDLELDFDKRNSSQSFLIKNEISDNEPLFINIRNLRI